MRAAAKYRPLQQDFTGPLLRFYVTKHLQMNTFEYVALGVNTDRSHVSLFPKGRFPLFAGTKGGQRVKLLKILSMFYHDCQNISCS